MAEQVWRCEKCHRVHSSQRFAEECEQGHVPTERLRIMMAEYRDAGRIPTRLTVRFGKEKDDVAIYRRMPMPKK